MDFQRRSVVLVGVWRMPSRSGKGVQEQVLPLDGIKIGVQACKQGKKRLWSEIKKEFESEHSSHGKTRDSY